MSFPLRAANKLEAEIVGRGGWQGERTLLIAWGMLCSWDEKKIMAERPLTWERVV
jgi:hypothetical protein